jgi:putative hydrolase of the HAD superfamily
MPIRTLLFDLGNVLVHFSHEQMCAQIAAVAGVPTRRIRQLLFDDRLQPRFERGEISESEFHAALERDLGQPLDFEALRRAGADIFELNHALALRLDGWKQAGVRLVLLSNTCVTHYEWVRRRFDLLDRFDDCVLSYKIGSLKPEEAIFRTALGVIGCRPEECFYTDDVPAHVERGRAMGLSAEVFTDVATLLRQLRGRGLPACEDDVPAGPVV